MDKNEIMEKRNANLARIEEMLKADAPNLEEVRNLKKAIEDMDSQLAEIRATELRAMNPNTNGGNKMDHMVNDLMEKRAIALGANGDMGYSEKLFEVKGNKSDILDAISIEYGAQPNTKFSLFSPSVNNVKRVSEDGTGSTVSTVAFAPVSVTPAPYLGYAPISDYFIKFAPDKAEAKLFDLYGKSFRTQMAKEVINGSGTGEMLGLFANTNISAIDCASTGAPVLKDLSALVAKMVGKFNRSELAIVINPTFWAAIKEADTKHSLVDGGSVQMFDGVKVIESDDAPSTTTGGDVVAVIGYLGDYGVAVASNLEMELLPKTAGSLNNTVQATAYFDGSVIVPSSFYALKAKAAG